MTLSCHYKASVFPFQNCVNSVSGFANSVFYRFRFYKFRFLPFQIFRIPFHFFKAVFLVSMIFLRLFGAIQVLQNNFFSKFDIHPLVTLTLNRTCSEFDMLVSRKSDNLPPPTALRNTWMAPLVVFYIFIWYSHVAQYLFGQLFDVWNVIKKINCFKHSFSFSILIKKFYSVTVLGRVTNAAMPPSLCSG